ncbi:MAG: hypothetical protein VB075_02655 [Petrimonas sp.]|uniref:hypothetical protein n=1 Tax=Petrimonas sp. TaxID=2023866 RepID=UPI002B3DC46A|nr:hypothetical protein [Petrimonas sp.]
MDAEDDHWSVKDDISLRRKWTVARWREAYQNDFAARMKWNVLSYDEANQLQWVYYAGKQMDL